MDPAKRDAARLAALIAVPVALVVGLASLWLTGALRGAPPDAVVPTAPTGPQATGPVQMTARPLDPAAAAACKALVAALPPAARTAARRPVTAGNAQNAAYGDPAITIECGTPPATYPPTDVQLTLNGVCWHAGPGAADTTRWTTVDRTVPVAVTLPDPYQPAAQWAVLFAGPVAATIPPAPTKPSGCSP